LSFLAQARFYASDEVKQLHWLMVTNIGRCKHLEITIYLLELLLLKFEHFLNAKKMLPPNL